MNWFAACARVSALAARAAAGFLRRDDGVAQTISFLLVVPLYLLFFYAVVETCLILTAKTGTMYAAFAAARTAVVHGEDPQAADRIRAAAILAFTPFSSSIPLGPASDSDAGEEAFIEAYRAAAAGINLSGDGVPRLRRQYRFARQAISVDTATEIRGEPWEEDVTVSVTYGFPFTFPVVGRFLGRPGAAGRYVYPIRSSATLPMEHPANERRQLGIAHAHF